MTWIVEEFNYTSGAVRGAFSPRDKPERTADREQRRANLRRVGRLFRPYKGKLGTVLAMIALSAIRPSTVPSFSL